MAPKLTSCDVFGMFLKYVLSTEGQFVGGEKADPAGLAGVLVSGGDMTCCCEEVVLCEACCCDVCWLCCVDCCCELWTVCCYMGCCHCIG